MNYQIIKDRTLLNEFIDWLPDLQDHEKFYYCCFSRKKYVEDKSKIPNSSTDKNQLKRGLSDKERLPEKLWQLEVPYGAYTNRTTKGPIPQESLAVYITPNPRDCKKATLNGIIGLVNAIKNNHSRFNPHQEILSDIHRTAGKKKYLLFDIDSLDENIIKKAIDIVDGHCSVIRTRGGFHLHVHLDKVKEISRPLWHNILTNIKEVDVTGDNMSPIVGCTQGDFVPYFYFKNGEFK